MSRLYFAIIILLAVGMLVCGMAVTADSLEELGGKPVTVLGVTSESDHTRITLLGKDYEIRFSELMKNLVPVDFYQEWWEIKRQTM
ncbi:MAG: hypothetical protein ACM3UW_06565 [Bacillota bacterium]